MFLGPCAITPYGVAGSQHLLVPFPWFTEKMSDDALLRLGNLKRLGLTPTELSESVGGRYTYWRDLLAGKKSFGEKIARKIEEKRNLRRGSLDDGCEPNAAPGWPYALFSQADYMLIDATYRQRIENELAGEVQRIKGAPAKQVQPQTVRRIPQLPSEFPQPSYVAPTYRERMAAKKRKSNDS